MRPLKSDLLHAANALTLLGLVCSFGVVALSAGGQVHWAFAALVAAGLCDLFDGFVARRLTLSEHARRFGEQLDSLVDACSFGLAPAALLFAALPAWGRWIAPPLLVSASVWRLAFFNATALEESSEPIRTYTGLPVTFVALVLPVVGLLAAVSPRASSIALFAASVATSALMVSALPIRKPGGVLYLVFALLALGVGGAHLALGF